MSDLYRIANFISDESLEAAQALIHQGVLVPDSRLDAITDAWNAYIECSDAWISQTSTRPDAWITLVRLLDALVGEQP